MALFGAGQFCFYLDRQTEARRYLLECVAIARETGSEAILARSLQPLGAADLAAGDLDAARSHLDEAVELARKLGEPREVASATNSLALLHRMQGRFEDADLLFQEVAALARSVGDQESTAMGLLNLSMTRVSAGRIEAVLPLVREVVTLAREIDSQPVWQSLADVCAGLASVLGKWDAAAFFFGAAETQSADARRPRYVADSVFLDPLMDRVRSALAGEAFGRAAAIGRSAPLAEFKRNVEAWVRETQPA
jgi:tetratricopeptide (TPR) repeat protein